MRWVIRFACAVLATYILLLAALDMWATYSTLPALLGSDLVEGYLPGAQRFLNIGTPYTWHQLNGPWTISYHSFVHPPAALPLFLPFLVLPLQLWWVLPIGLTAYAIGRLHPAPWTWPVMALCLLWPRSVGSLVVGNTDMWAMAAVAAGTIWGWPVVLLAIKPTFAPLALVGVRHRSTWIAAAVSLAFVVLTAPLWWQWWTAIGNAGLGWAYSVFNLPLVALPLVAWLGRRQTAVSSSSTVVTSTSSSPSPASSSAPRTA